MKSVQIIQPTQNKHQNNMNIFRYLVRSVYLYFFFKFININFCYFFAENQPFRPSISRIEWKIRPINMIWYLFIDANIWHTFALPIDSVILIEWQ